MASESLGTFELLGHNENRPHVAASFSLVTYGPCGGRPGFPAIKWPQPAGLETHIFSGSAMSRFTVGLRRHCYFADRTRTRLPESSAIELRLHECHPARSPRYDLSRRPGHVPRWQAPYGGPVGNQRCTPCGLEPHARRRASPERVQADSHRLIQVFHRVLLALASSIGDDSPGRRRATARRLPERPHACCGCGEDDKCRSWMTSSPFSRRMENYYSGSSLAYIRLSHKCLRSASAD